MAPFVWKASTGIVDLNKTIDPSSGWELVKADESVVAPGRLQVPHDAAIRLEFDTIQVLEDVRIPKGDWEKASHLEPFDRRQPYLRPRWCNSGSDQSIVQNQRDCRY